MLTLKLTFAAIAFFISSQCAFGQSNAQSQAIVALPQITEVMRQYSHIKYALYFIGTAYLCIVFFGIIATGLSAAIRSGVEQLAKNEIVRFLCYSAVVYLIIAISTAPLIYYSGFHLEHQYGLSHQTLLDWMSDQTKLISIGFCLTAPVFGSFFFLSAKVSPSMAGFVLPDKFSLCGARDIH